MLFVDGPQGKLFQMALNGTTVVELSSAARKPQNPVAVDYDPLTRWIYWTDIETHTIRRTKLTTDGLNGGPSVGASSVGSSANSDQVFLQLTPGLYVKAMSLFKKSCLVYYSSSSIRFLVAQREPSAVSLT
jgi:hypothetical protein